MDSLLWFECIEWLCLCMFVSDFVCVLAVWVDREMRVYLLLDFPVMLAKMEVNKCGHYYVFLSSHYLCG